MCAPLQVRSSLDEVVLPEMRRRYNTRPLACKEVFVARYEHPEDVTDDGAPGGSADGATGRPRQAGLRFHRDGTLLNAVILLSDPTAFEGGGTVFAAPTCEGTYRTNRGDVLCSSGQLRHGAADVTRGVRHVLVAFIDEQQPEVEARVLALEAAEASDDDERASGDEYA